MKEGPLGCTHPAMPTNAAPAAATSKQTFEHNINVTLKDKNGTPVAPPIAINKQVGTPQPAGTR
jgi:hypothetical protein